MDKINEPVEKAELTPEQQYWNEVATAAELRKINTSAPKPLPVAEDLSSTYRTANAVADSEPVAINIQPVTDMQLSLGNWDLIRQWFNAVHDLNSDYLTEADIHLYQMITQHLERFNCPLPAPRFAGAEIFSKAEQLKRTKAQLGNVGAELEEMHPERLHELLASIPAAPTQQVWNSNYDSMPQAGTVKASAPAWYDYEQQKAVIAPPVGCEVIVMKVSGLGIMDGAEKFIGAVSKVVNDFQNNNGIRMVTVELPNGTCCCFVLEMIAPIDFDKPTFNKFSAAACKALNLQRPNTQALTNVLEKLYKAGFKAPEQSE